MVYEVSRRYKMMGWFIDYAFIIGALAGAVAVIASVLGHIGDRRQAKEVAERQTEIIELQGKLQAETQEVTESQQEIIALQAELNRQSERSVAYLRGDDSYVYLEYGNLNQDSRRVALRHFGPNPVWDIGVYSYDSGAYLSRKKAPIAELALNVFTYEATSLLPERSVLIPKYRMPDAKNPSTWNRYIEFYTRGGSWMELLLTDYRDGNWSQGHIIYAVEDGQAVLLGQLFDEQFPVDRRERALDQLTAASPDSPEKVD